MSLADSLSEEEEDFLMSSDEDDDDNKLATSKKRKSPSSTKEKNDKSNKKQTKETNKATKSSSATDTLLTTSKNAPKLTLSSAAVTSSSSSSAGGLTNQSIKGVGNTNINIEEDITRGPDVHTEAAAKTLVMKYMIKENRPYSAIQIYDNLHHRIQKSTLEKVLTTLCESYTTSSAGAKQRLLCKEYGKAKIYYPDQNCFEAMSEHELDQLSTQIDMLTKEADKAQKQNRELNARIATLLAEPSDDDIDRFAYMMMIVYT